MRVFRMLVLAASLALAASPPAAAQGFNMFSGRNHPELDWQVAETEHFEIMYPAHLAGIEVEAAPIAEETYRALSANLDVTFDARIRIYLSDEDEITNGFAMPIGSGYTNIWVHVNDASSVWTGEVKWLRKVIAHELAHIFHFRATRSNIGLLSNLFSEPMPAFWAEGFAQYQTERWDAQRGDRWLRTAVLEDRLSYDDNASLWNGRLLYAIGNSQARFFAEQYGDSTLARLLRHRKRELFGIARVHDFRDALKATIRKPYRQFYDDWRRHVNVYYNTIAGQLDNLDSLRADTVRAPGQYFYDVQYSPDTTRIAVLALSSLNRPVRRLMVTENRKKAAGYRIVAEGAIQPPFAWSPDGRRIAFARTEHGRHSSLVNDVYVVNADGGGLRRVTRSRRAVSPTWAPDGRRLAYIASERGTANLFVHDLETGAETQVTRFRGDVQLATVRWHPTDDRLVFDRFDANGARDIVLIELASGALRVLTSGPEDNRLPIWSPDGSRIAFTSFRDEVPNVFVADLASLIASAGLPEPEPPVRRVTRLAVGAAAYDWLPPDSARAAGSLAVVSNHSKERDAALRIDAGRTAPDSAVTVPAPYAAWTDHRPPHEIPFHIPPDASLIGRRYAYSSWKNISHALTFGLPYYGTEEDWGFFGTTTWMEPLGKHTFSFLGGISIPTFRKNSFFLATYLNNQLYPTLAFSAYRFPADARFYGSDLLVEDLTGGDATAIWPVDLFDVPYSATQLYAGVRYVHIKPLNPEVAGRTPETLPAPESGEQAQAYAALYWKKQRPYRFNTIHPIDGLGVRAQLTAAGRVLGGRTAFLEPDVSAYGIFRSGAMTRLYLYGRAQARIGRSLAQDYLGLSRYDNIDLLLPGYVPLSLGEVERVRGYRRYALGNRVLFATAEYRVPLYLDLETRLLGFIEFGQLALTGFADAGLVWTGSNLDAADRRLGLGLELKNTISIGGLEILHAVGVAQPYDRFGDFTSPDRYEIYYRVKAAVPF